MKRYGVPILLVPLADRVKVEFLEYRRDHADELSENQKDVLLRYSENEEIKDLIVNQFFDMWWNNDRNGFLEVYAQNYIKELLKVYK